MVTDLRFGNVVVERRRKQILNIVGFVVSVEYVGLILSKLVLIMDRSRSLEHFTHTHRTSALLYAVLRGS